MLTFGGRCLVAFAAASSLLVLELWLGLACSHNLIFVGSSLCWFLLSATMIRGRVVQRVGSHLA